MKHALRKYITPCGSALFMVVSTMAALIVLVTAMYMSVLSSRQVQYATFDQEQAYVSSTSIADIVGSYIAGNTGSALNKKLLDLKEGESISTNGNGFSSLTGVDTDKDDTILGAYTVDITRLKGEELSGVKYSVYDIAVTVSQNDILETTHTYMKVKEGEKPEIPDLSRCFTATGYVPNDVLLQSVVINTTAYYDSEYVKFSDQIELGYTGTSIPNSVIIKGGLICAGTVVFDQPNQAVRVEVTEPTKWFVGNNMYVTNGNPFPCNLGGEGTINSAPLDDRGILVVGQDLDITSVSQFGGTGPTDVYVLGNLSITGEKSHNTYFNGNVYVAGNVTVDSVVNFNGNLYVGGNLSLKNAVSAKGIYVTSGSQLDIGPNKYNPSQLCVNLNGTVINNLNPISSNIWDVDNPGDTAMTMTKAGEELTNAIGASVYPKWRADISNASKKIKNIFFNGSTTDDADTSQVKVIGVSADKTPSLQYYYSEIKKEQIPSVIPKNTRTVFIDEDCTIGDIIDVGQQGEGKGSTGGAHAIIIDTGDEGTTRTINLRANVKFNDSDKCNGFSWAVAHASKDRVDIYDDSKLDDSKYGEAVSVLTVGNGKLVINVPDGVTYQMAHNEFVGHYAWFMFNGGSYNSTRDEYKMGSANPDSVKGMIHHADSCGGKCEYVLKKDKNGAQVKDSDGNDVYTCKTHGGYVQGGKPADGACECDDRIEKNMFTGEKYYFSGTGEYQKPNVNIFLVSCDESADIQVGCLKYKTGDEKSLVCEFYGYIYAPYMTYIDMTAGTASGLKMCGGLIVSDYVMSGYFQYVHAWPDETLEEIIGDNYEPVTPNANRSWRVYGV